MKPVYIASYRQSKFGKLLGMTVPQIMEQSVLDACAEIDVPASAIDVGSVGAACNDSPRAPRTALPFAFHFGVRTGGDAAGNRGGVA